jgi:hypothetical protein
MEGLLTVTARPNAVGEANPVTLIVPVSPRLVRVTVKVVEPPATKLAGDGLLPTSVKSPATVTLTVVLWDTEPLVPKTVTKYVPAGVDGVVVIVNKEWLVEPAVNPRMVVLNEKESPVTEGAFRLTVPVNPKLVTVMIDVVDPLATMLPGPAEEAVMVRSPPTLTETRIE